MLRATYLRFLDKGPGVLKSIAVLLYLLETAKLILRAWQGDLCLNDRLTVYKFLSSQSLDFGIGLLVSV